MTCGSGRAAGLLSLDINGLKVGHLLLSSPSDCNALPCESLSMSRHDHSRPWLESPHAARDPDFVPQILEQGGEPNERKYASAIMPVREKGNLLLCTLLLGNTIVNAATSIVVADVTSGIVGLFISTFLIVIFGEVRQPSDSVH